MIDFETLDTRPTAVALSLGCVLFDESGIISTQEFKFEIQEQLDTGRTVCSSTLAWWFQQAGSARQVFEKSRDEIPATLVHVKISNWLDRNSVDREQLKVWGNGANFDVPLLDSLCVGYEKLYEYWNVWCFRTFDKITGCKKLAKRKGTHHNALDDAIYQAECVIEYWKQQAG